MARLVRGRRIIDDSSDDEFPDILQLGSLQTKGSKNVQPSPARQLEGFVATKGIVKRRKLGPISDNAVLRPAMLRETSGTIFDDDDTGRNRMTKPRRIELQTKRAEPAAKKFEIEIASEAESVQEETIIEDFSCDDESDSEESQSSESERDDPTSGLVFERPAPVSLKRPADEPKARTSGVKRRSPSPSSQLLSEASKARERGYMQASSSGKGMKSESRPTSQNSGWPESTTPIDLTGPFTKSKAYDTHSPILVDVRDTNTV